MIKRFIGILVIIMTTVLLLSGCGDSAQNQAGAEPADETVSEPADEPAAEPAEEMEAEAVDPSVNPYAFLGLEDIPKCNYLDIYSTYHYIQTYEAYAMSSTVEETEAKDGACSYKENSSTRTYSTGEKVYSINDNSKVYMEMDLGSTGEAAEKRIKEAMASGENIIGRSFIGTGSDKIPQYCDNGDETEYEYYEYNYPASEEEVGANILERFYMKDGDIFAIYQKTEWGESVIEYTQMIKSISSDVPEGIFDVPDLSEYQKY